MSGLDTWLAARTAGAPEALRQQVATWVRSAGPGGEPGGILAAAGLAAREAAIGQGRDRAAALDLLAADALVTLALLARAEADPGSVSGHARRLRQEGAAGA